MREKIIYKGELNLTNKTVKIKSIDNDIWADFGYWLEALGFMTRQAALYKEKSIEEMAEYAKQYLIKAAKDYKVQ